LKKWAKEMCFVVVASSWMIRVHGLGDLKIAFYQNVLPVIGSNAANTKLGQMLPGAGHRV